MFFVCLTDRPLNNIDLTIATKIMTIAPKIMTKNMQNNYEF